MGPGRYFHLPCAQSPRAGKRRAEGIPFPDVLYLGVALSSRIYLLLENASISVRPTTSEHYWIFGGYARFIILISATSLQVGRSIFGMYPFDELGEPPLLRQISCLTRSLFLVIISFAALNISAIARDWISAAAKSVGNQLSVWSIEIWFLTYQFGNYRVLVYLVSAELTSFNDRVARANFVPHFGYVTVVLSAVFLMFVFASFFLFAWNLWCWKSECKLVSHKRLYYFRLSGPQSSGL